MNIHYIEFEYLMKDMSVDIAADGSTAQSECEKERWIYFRTDHRLLRILNIINFYSNDSSIRM